MNYKEQIPSAPQGLNMHNRMQVKRSGTQLTVGGIRLFITFALLCAAFTASAQYSVTSYFMDKAPMRHFLNPALQPARGHVGLLIGNTYASVGTNGVSLEDLVYKRNGDLVLFMNPAVSSTDFLGNLKEMNTLQTSTGYNLLSLGFWFGYGFATFDINLRSNATLSAPKDLFRLMKSGMNPEGETALNMDKFGFQAQSYLEAAVGYSEAVNDRLTLGGKVKFLLGLAQADLQFSRFRANLSDSNWSIDSQAEGYITLPGIEPTYDPDEPNIIDGFEGGKFGIPGKGLAFDAGFTYQLLDNLTLSGAVTDFGFIRWSENATIYAQTAGGEVNFPGFTYDGDETMESQADRIIDDLTGTFKLQDSGRKALTTYLTTNANVGLEYSLLDDHLSFGLLSSTHIGRNATLTELTASANFRPLRWLAGTLSYSALHSSFKTFGVGLNVSTALCNIFVASDYVLTKVSPQYLPVSVPSANIQAGIVIPLSPRPALSK